MKNAIPAYERLISLPLGEGGPLAVDEVSNSFVQQKKNPHQSCIRFAAQASFASGTQAASRGSPRIVSSPKGKPRQPSAKTGLYSAESAKEADSALQRKSRIEERNPGLRKAMTYDLTHMTYCSPSPRLRRPSPRRGLRLKNVKILLENITHP